MASSGLAVYEGLTRAPLEDSPRYRDTIDVLDRRCVDAGGYRQAQICKDILVPVVCNWVLCEQHFLQWRGTNASEILWISGDSSTGKTQMALVIVDDFRKTELSTASTALVLSFFCSSGRDGRRSVTNILESLILQILVHREDLYELVKRDLAHDTSDFYDQRKNFDGLWPIFRRLIEQVTVFCVLDGLNECSADPHLPSFLYHRQRLQRVGDRVSKVVVLSRASFIGVSNPFPRVSTMDLDNKFRDRIRSELWTYIYYSKHTEINPEEARSEFLADPTSPRTFYDARQRYRIHSIPESAAVEDQSSDLDLFKAVAVAFVPLTSQQLESLHLLPDRARQFDIFARYEQFNVLLEVHSEALARLNERDSSGQTALTWAAQEGWADFIAYLVEKGKSNLKVDQTAGPYGGALHAAAACGHINCVKVLLDGGADINRKTDKYGTALQAAAMHGHVEIVRELLTRRAKKMHKRPHGFFGNALQAAAANGSLEIVQLLLDCQVDRSESGGWFGNALTTAATKGHIECVKLLCDGKASLEPHNVRLLRRIMHSGMLCVFPGLHIKALLEIIPKVVKLAKQKAKYNGRGGKRLTCKEGMVFAMVFPEVTRQQVLGAFRTFLADEPDDYFDALFYKSPLEAARGQNHEDIVCFLESVAGEEEKVEDDSSSQGSRRFLIKLP